MELKEYQIKLPEPNAPTQTLPAGIEAPTLHPDPKEKKPARRKQPRCYTLAKDTTLRTGPVGGTGEFLGHVEKSTTVRVRSKVIISGIVSFLVEVESPPEQKGRVFWVTRRSAGGKGFI